MNDSDLDRELRRRFREVDALRKSSRSRWRIVGDVFLLAAIVYLTVRLFVPFIGLLLWPR